jgi:hypothetical protein
MVSGYTLANLMCINVWQRNDNAGDFEWLVTVAFTAKYHDCGSIRRVLVLVFLAKANDKSPIR